MASVPSACAGAADGAGFFWKISARSKRSKALPLAEKSVSRRAEKSSASSGHTLSTHQRLANVMSKRANQRNRESRISATHRNQSPISIAWRRDRCVHRGNILSTLDPWHVVRRRGGRGLSARRINWHCLSLRSALTRRGAYTEKANVM